MTAGAPTRARRGRERWAWLALLGLMLCLFGAPARAQSAPIREADVSLSKVASLLQLGALQAVVNEDTVIVQTEGMIVLVTVSDSLRMIRIVASFSFRSTASEASRNALVNRLNGALVFARFTSVATGRGSGTMLLADHYLSYEGGLLPYHLVNAVRWLATTSRDGIVRYDTEDLVL